MNCLNINRIKICRVQCLGIVTVKVLSKSYFLFNTEGKTTQFLIPKMKLKKLMRVSLCKFYNKMFKGF